MACAAARPELSNPRPLSRMFASTIFSILGPKLLGNATTTLFAGVMAQIAGTGTIDFGSIGRIILEVLFLYLLSALFAYIQGWVMSGISMNITYRFRKDISQKINRMPLRYFDGTLGADVVAANGVEKSEHLSHGLPESLPITR